MLPIINVNWAIPGNKKPTLIIASFCLFLSLFINHVCQCHILLPLRFQFPCQSLLSCKCWNSLNTLEVRTFMLKKSLKKSLMSNIYRLQRTKLQAIETNQIDISINIYLLSTHANDKIMPCWVYSPTSGSCTCKITEKTSKRSSSFDWWFTTPTQSSVFSVNTWSDMVFNIYVNIHLLGTINGLVSIFL